MNIYSWSELNPQQKQTLLARPAMGDTLSMKEKTRSIVQRVREQGDHALFDLTATYDGITLAELTVSNAEIAAAHLQITETAKQAILFAKQQIARLHQAHLPQTQRIENSSGVYCERQARALESVGLYIPGGSAPLVSTVLMLAVPAQLANCPTRILCTPPNKKGSVDPHLLFAAQLCEIQSVYKIGGAQAIAAMAYGTETIPKVNKIFGPGNSWVTQAKMLVAQDPHGAGIDMPAGPSEVMVIADSQANPYFVAADLLAQAEHGIDSQVMLISLSAEFAETVKNVLLAQLDKLPRIEIIKKALTHSRIIIVDSMQQALQISNAYAPEHLILQVDHYQQYVPMIINAGAVFLGPWTPETLGDYVTGSNHVLPTYGYARSVSGLSIIDFMKYVSFQTVTAQGLQEIGKHAEILAEIEGLQAHKNAVAVRFAESIKKS